APHFIKTVARSEDPIKSMALSRWIAGALPPQKPFCERSGGPLMEKFIHQQNLPLLEASRRAAQRRGARNAQEVADRRASERTATKQGIHQVDLAPSNRRYV